MNFFDNWENPTDITGVPQQAQEIQQPQGNYWDNNDQGKISNLDEFADWKDNGSPDKSYQEESGTQRTQEELWGANTAAADPFDHWGGASITIPAHTEEIKSENKPVKSIFDDDPFADIVGMQNSSQIPQSSDDKREVDNDWDTSRGNQPETAQTFDHTKANTAYESHISRLARAFETESDDHHDSVNVTEEKPSRTPFDDLPSERENELHVLAGQSAPPTNRTDNVYENHPAEKDIWDQPKSQDVPFSHQPNLDQVETTTKSDWKRNNTSDYENPSSHRQEKSFDQIKNPHEKTNTFAQVHKDDTYQTDYAATKSEPFTATISNPEPVASQNPGLFGAWGENSTNQNASVHHDEKPLDISYNHQNDAYGHHAASNSTYEYEEAQRLSHHQGNIWDTKPVEIEPTRKISDSQYGAHTYQKNDYHASSHIYQPNMSNDNGTNDYHERSHTPERNDSKLKVYQTPDRTEERSAAALYDNQHHDYRQQGEPSYKGDSHVEVSLSNTKSPLANVFLSPPGKVAEEVSANELDRDEIYEKACALLECKRSNKNFVRPLAKYIVELANIYAKDDVRRVPQRLAHVIENEEKGATMFANHVQTDVSKINSIIDDLQNKVILQLQGLKDNIANLAKEKKKDFQNNQELYRHTIQRFYPGGKPKKPPIEEVVHDLSNITEEKDLKNYLANLLPKEEVENAETQNYLNFLAQKVESQEQCTFKNSRKDISEESISQVTEAVTGQIQLLSDLAIDHFDYLYTFEDLAQYKTNKIKLYSDRTSIIKPIIAPANIDEGKYYYKPKKTLVTHQSDGVNCLTVLDNKIIAVGSNDTTIGLYRLSDFVLLDVLKGHKDAISALNCFSASRTDLKAKAPRANSLEEDKVTLLVSGSSNNEGRIAFWDISWIFEIPENQPGHPSNTLAPTRISYLDTEMKSKLVRRVEGHKQGVTSLMELGDGLSLFSGSTSGQISVWNVLKNKQIGQLGYHKALVSSIKLLADKFRIASGSWDRTIAIWKIKYDKIKNSHSAYPDREVLDKCELEKIIDPGFPIMALNAFAKKPNWIIFAGGINRIILWDLDLGRLVREYECETSNVTELMLLEDDQMERFYITGICTNDDTLRVWSGSYKEQGGVEGEIYNLKDREKVFAGSSGITPKMQFLIDEGEPTLAVINNIEDKASVSFLHINI